MNLFDAVRATCYGFKLDVPSFHAVLELYCPSTGTLFTPVGELGLAMHEMWEISRLQMGVYLNEEYVPCNEEQK